MIDDRSKVFNAERSKIRHRERAAAHLLCRQRAVARPVEAVESEADDQGRQGDEGADRPAEQCRAAGLQVWTYICLGPRYPFANWLADDPLVEALLRERGRVACTIRCFA